MLRFVPSLWLDLEIKLSRHPSFLAVSTPPSPSIVESRPILRHSEVGDPVEAVVLLESGG